MKAEHILISDSNCVSLVQHEQREQLQPDQFLVQTEYTFISAGTELSIYTGAEPKVREPGAWCAYPFAPGYANVGKVIAVGDAVDAPAVGARIFTLGNHSSHVVVAVDAFWVPVPDSLAPQWAVASRMAGVACTAVNVAAIGMNPWVVVYGLGLVGNLAAQALQTLGGRVVGIDPLAARRRLAELCGIQTTLGGTPEEVHAALQEVTGSHLADISVDAVGHSAVIAQALAATADFGQVILLGTPRQAHATDVTPQWADIHLRGLVVRGALEWDYAYHPGAGMGGTFGFSLCEKQQHIFDWLQRGKLSIAPLISHEFKPERIKQAYDGLRDEPETYTGVVLDWT